MARAHSVFIVRINTHIVAAFTVKRECRTWLSRTYPSAPTNLRVLRVPDGGYGKDRDVTAEMYGFDE